MYHYGMSTAADNPVELTVTDARAQLAELLDTRVRDGEVVYLTRYGRRVGAVVPAEVAEHLDDIEDAYWSARVQQVLAKGEPTVPWPEALTRLEAEDVDL
jgi:prevent-host-death family protein